MEKILFIAPVFFGYHDDIIRQMTILGYDVTFYSDRPSESFFTKAFIRFNKRLLSRKINKYIDSIVKETKNINFDYVLVILGQSFSRCHIERIKQANPNSFFVYFSWDSVDNFPNILSYRDLFNKIYHFDKKDSTEYGFTFLPLFYSNEPIECALSYSYSAVFTVKKGKTLKFDLVNRLIPDSFKKNSFVYQYLQSRLLYFYYKLFTKELRGRRMKDYRFKKMSRNDFYNVINKSFVVIDTQMDNQRGLTIRTIEALHAKKKIITTNTSIKTYDFYSPHNIFVADGDSKTISEEFFLTPFDDSFSVGKDYSLESFVKKLLNKEID